MSAVSKMSLTPNGTPFRKPRLPLLSEARAAASACSRSRWAQARITGSRPAIRAGALLGVRMGPGADPRPALGDTVEAAAHDCFGGQLAIVDRPGERDGGKAVRFGVRHGGLGRIAPPSSHSRNPGRKVFGRSAALRC